MVKVCIALIFLQGLFMATKLTGIARGKNKAMHELRKQQHEVYKL